MSSPLIFFFRTTSNPTH